MSGVPSWAYPRGTMSGPIPEAFIPDAQEALRYGNWLAYGRALRGLYRTNVSNSPYPHESFDQIRKDASNIEGKWVANYYGAFAQGSKYLAICGGGARGADAYILHPSAYDWVSLTLGGRPRGRCPWYVREETTNAKFDIGWDGDWLIYIGADGNTNPTPDNHATTYYVLRNGTFGSYGWQPPRIGAQASPATTDVNLGDLYGITSPGGSAVLDAVELPLGADGADGLQCSGVLCSKGVVAYSFDAEIFSGPYDTDRILWAAPLELDSGQWRADPTAWQKITTLTGSDTSTGIVIWTPPAALSDYWMVCVTAPALPGDPDDPGFNPLYHDNGEGLGNHIGAATVQLYTDGSHPIPTDIETLDATIPGCVY